MRRFAPHLICLALLAGCNTPGPHFRGLPATRVTVEGLVFDVRVRGRLAEAMRVNIQYAPRFGPIRERAGRAMAQVSGCEVTEVRGDQALATGILDCGGGAPDLQKCMADPRARAPGFGPVGIELQCFPL